MAEIGLYQKISKVMQDIQYLAKDGKIEYKNTRYKAITEEKVTGAVREALIKHGLVIIPVEQEHLKEGTLTTVNTKYKIIDIDTGQFEIIASSGTGVDTQDKGVGKAMTYSYKYMLLRTFAIPTGEDPDKISSDELDDELNKEKTEDKVTIGQVKTMESLLKKVDEGYTKRILDFNKVKSLSDLTPEQYGKAMFSIKTLLEKEK